MAVRMHKELANGRWVTKLEEFWTWCHLLYMRHNVDVLMGDFNMSLFNVIPEFRNRGAILDLAAWYPKGRIMRAFLAPTRVAFFA